MKISALITNSFQNNEIVVSTEGNSKNVAISPKADGYGLSLNGGELLFLSLATCFCNNLYREAKKRDCEVSAVKVLVTGEFGSEGEAAKNIFYEVFVEAPSLTQEEISSLIKHVDQVAEIHKTLRNGIEVKLR